MSSTASTSKEQEELEWLAARFGPYSVENPPLHPMEVFVREGDYHAVAFISAMRRLSRPHSSILFLPTPNPPSANGTNSDMHAHGSTLNGNDQQPSQHQHASTLHSIPQQPLSRQQHSLPQQQHQSHQQQPGVQPILAESALSARPGQWRGDRTLSQSQTYLHVACQYVIQEDPEVLLNMLRVLLHENYSAMAETTDGATPLHVLVQEQPHALEAIKLLIEHGADVNHVTDKGLSILHTLAHSYQPHCLKAMELLVSFGADLRAISIHGWSIMHTFARYNAEPYDCIKYLIDMGVSVHSQTDERCTVLHALARCVFKGEYTRSSEEMLRTLRLVCEKGVDVNARTVKGWTALHYTAKDNPEPVKALEYLLSIGADVNVIGADGWSVLHCLVRYNKRPLEAVRLLVSKGIDVNVLKAHHQTALHSLAKHCQDSNESYESIKALLEAGVDVNTRGKKMWTTLHYLVYSNMSPALSLRLLLENGARVDDKTADGWSPTHLLANSNQDPLDALKILVEFGADVNAVGKNEWSVLHSVARCTPQPLESIRFLLSKGADPTVTTQDGWSVLHFLANYCTEPLESMRLLIEHGADVNAKTKSDWTSLHLVARANKNPYKLFELLLEKGADAKAIGHKDWTVLHSLVRYNHSPYECIQLLLKAGADFMRRTGSDWTCMDLLTRYCPNAVPSMRLLLSKGAEMTNQSIFHVAEHNQTPVEALELIISYKPGICREVDSKGNTPMHAVVTYQDHPIPALEVLLRGGGDLNAKGYMSKTPLYDAIHGSEDTELLDWMLEHGANPFRTVIDSVNNYPPGSLAAQMTQQSNPLTNVNSLVMAAQLGKENFARVIWEWIGDQLTLQEIELARSEAQSRRVREFLRRQIQKRIEMGIVVTIVEDENGNEVAASDAAAATTSDAVSAVSAAVTAGDEDEGGESTESSPPPEVTSSHSSFLGELELDCRRTVTYNKTGIRTVTTVSRTGPDNMTIVPRSSHCWKAARQQFAVIAL